MEREQKDNTGVLFKNKNKTRDAQPDWQGLSMINGKEMWVSVWVNTSRDGNTVYQKLTYAEPKEKGSSLGNADLVTPADTKKVGWEPDTTPLDDTNPF